MENNRKKNYKIYNMKTKWKSSSGLSASAIELTES